MSEFQELIKNFDKCRDYVRDFFIYGFKSRDDFSQKSARTYDDERRRIESWLQDYVQHDYVDKNTKNISLQMDVKLLDVNPLYQVWKTKSFTDNDIILHFLLLDACSIPLSINELADIFVERYQIDLDSQMIRRKCKEYAKLGLLQESKEKKTAYYQVSPSLADFTEDLEKVHRLKKDVPSEHRSLKGRLEDALCFYQGFLPFGILANTILTQEGKANHIFRSKHSFLVHTLEDEILLQLLTAMKTPSYVKLSCRNGKKQEDRVEYGMPLQIFVSSKTGRRFLCLYHKKRFHTQRLDQIKKILILSEKNSPNNFWPIAQEELASYDRILQKLEKNKSSLWGISFQGDAGRGKENNASCRTRLQTLRLTLSFSETYEDYILQRLEREGRHGTITKLAPDTFLYEIKVFDVNEMKPFIRSFLGRILDVEVLADNKAQSPNQLFKKYFKADMDALYAMYDIDSP